MFRSLKLNRRAGFALALLCAAMTGTSPAQAAEPLVVRMEWSVNAMQLPFYLAIARGWYKAADLDVKLEDGTGSTSTVQLVSSNNYEIGQAVLAPMAVARGTGQQVIAIAEFFRKGDIGIIAPQSLHLTKPSDLIGKKVLYTASSFEGPFVSSFFPNNGVPLDRITLLNVNPAAKVSLYLVGNADAAISTVPYLLPLVADKRPSDAILFSSFGYPLPSYGLIVAPAALQKKGPAIRRFASIIGAAWEYILANDSHVDEAIKATLSIRPDSPVPGPALKEAVAGYRDYFMKPTEDKLIGTQNAAAWEKTIALMESLKVIPPGTHAKDYFTNDYLDAAYGRSIVADRH